MKRPATKGADLAISDNAESAPPNVTVLRFKRLPLLQLEIDLYLHYLLRVRKVRPTTYASIRLALRIFMRTLAENALDYSPRMIGPLLMEDVLRIHEERGVSKFTYVGFFSTIRRFFKYLVEKRVIPYSPFDQIESPETPELVPKPLSEEEVRKLLDAPDLASFFGLRTRVILEILYGSGLRIRECLGLKKCDLRFGSNREPYFALFGKGGKYREVPCTDLAARLLLDYAFLAGVEKEQDLFFSGHASDVPVSYSSFQRIFTKLLTAHSLPSSFTLHRLRHSFASHLLDHGADIKSVQELMGHSSIITTMGYTRVSTTRLREVHRLFHPRSLPVIGDGRLD
jgi:site-specific recombinase XerD